MSANQETITSAMENMTRSSPPKHNLADLIPEILDHIINYVLADPQQPDFCTNSSGKYDNYLSLLCVNKSLKEATESAIARAKNLIVFSSNFQYIAKSLRLNGIPIVAKYVGREVKCHVMRLHVNLPDQNSPKVASQLLMRKSDLEALAKCLRILSLCYKHQADEPQPILVGVDIPSPQNFPRMGMTIIFQKSGGKDLTREMISTLLLPLKIANKIGSITILGAVDASVSSILPGHDENFRPWNGPTEETDQYAMEVIAWGKKNRKEDGEDYVTLMKWLMGLGDYAREHYDLEVTASRYNFVVHLGLCARFKNPLAFEADEAVLLQVRKLMFRANLRVNECFMGMGYSKSAAANIAKLFDHPDIGAIEAEDMSFLTDLRDKIKNRDKSKDKGNGFVPESLIGENSFQVTR